MNFHSVQFLVFLAVVLVSFWSLANHRTLRTWLLTIASFYFYGCYEVWYLGLLLFSILIDWNCGNAIRRASERGDRRGMKVFLMVSLVCQLGVLAFFKYTDWLFESLQQASAALRLEVDLLALRESLLPEWMLDPSLTRILVPAGISFYTFQTLSYTIDIYRGHLKPAKNLLEFAFFVAFFPQLVAGPIVRASQFLPQIELRPRWSRERLHDGLWRIATGLLKKIALADVLGAYLVDPVYAQPELYSSGYHLVALYGFAFQIYLDFAGYSDVAIGTSKLFGFDLPDNFNAPYRSRSVREFWWRWHISLSTWVRDYVYFPLGGSRGSEGRVAFNLMSTMLLLGVWHGASWLWVLYGLVQGLMMILQRQLDRWRGGREFSTTPARSLLAWALTFHFFLFFYLFVRSRDMDNLVAILTDFGPIGVGEVSVYAWLALIVAATSHFLPTAATQATKRVFVRLPTLLVGVGVGVASGCVAVLVVGETPYIYFQF